MVQHKDLILAVSRTVFLNASTFFDQATDIRLELGYGPTQGPDTGC